MSNIQAALAGQRDGEEDAKASAPTLIDALRQYALGAMNERFLDGPEYVASFETSLKRSQQLLEQLLKQLLDVTIATILKHHAEKDAAYHRAYTGAFERTALEEVRAALPMDWRAYR